MERNLGTDFKKRNIRPLDNWFILAFQNLRIPFHLETHHICVSRSCSEVTGFYMVKPNIFIIIICIIRIRNNTTKDIWQLYLDHSSECLVVLDVIELISNCSNFLVLVIFICIANLAATALWSCSSRTWWMMESNINGG